MINILHIIHKYRGNYGLLNQQVNLDPERFRTIVCYLSGEDDGRNGLDVAGIKTLYLGFKPNHLRFHNISLLRRLRTIIDEENIHVINCQQHRSTPVGILAASLAVKKPSVVSTLHGLGTVNSFRRKLLNWILYKKLFRIIGISQGVSADILQTNWRLGEDKVVTIQNGLVYDRFLVPLDKRIARERILPEAVDGFWFGTAGRLSSVKNHETLLRVFKQVMQQEPRSVLVIAGDGELKDTLADLVSSLGIAEQVHFLGFRRDVPEILKSLDVFLLPSLREGLPLALLEAMATGLPVVAAAVGGIPEVMGNEDFGLLVDPHVPQDIAAAMIRMASLSPDELRQKGESARRRALEDFSAARMIEEYQQIYQLAYQNWQQRQGEGE